MATIKPANVNEYEHIEQVRMDLQSMLEDVLASPSIPDAEVRGATHERMSGLVYDSNAALPSLEELALILRRKGFRLQMRGVR